MEKYSGGACLEGCGQSPQHTWPCIAADILAMPCTAWYVMCVAFIYVAENEHHSYHFFDHFFEFTLTYNSVSKPPESSNLIFSNSYLSARGLPTSGLNS